MKLYIIQIGEKYYLESYIYQFTSHKITTTEKYTQAQVYYSLQAAQSVAETINGKVITFEKVGE